MRNDWWAGLGYMLILYNWLPRYVISLHLGPNIPFSVLSSYSHNLCRPISGRHQVSRPFKQQTILHFRNHSRLLSQWPRGLRRGFEVARLLRFWVRIPLAGMDVCCECFVLSGRGLCDELITLLEESYRLWCGCVWSRNLVNEEALA
jgi:hypothetical protein